MLSIPHMIVVFIVVLVVFGPQKLPELARTFGRLMAEFRKASGDFKNAFEDEMREIERQTRLAEIRKQAAEAAAAASEAVKNPISATLGSPEGTPALPASADTRLSEAPNLQPNTEAVARLDASPEPAAPSNLELASPDGHAPAAPASEPSPSHDQQQPAR